jgi:hypothetical protein
MLGLGDSSNDMFYERALSNCSTTFPSRRTVRHPITQATQSGRPSGTNISSAYYPTFSSPLSLPPVFLSFHAFFLISQREPDGSSLLEMPDGPS